MSEGDVIVEVAANESQPTAALSVEEALQIVLKNALYHDGLARGLRESAKALDRKEAHLCVLAESCNEQAYIKLVEALCKSREINLIKVADAKKLGEWVGLCKIDKNGVAQKVVGCGCVVVKNYGTQTEALNVILEYFKQH